MRQVVSITTSGASNSSARYCALIDSTIWHTGPDNRVCPWPAAGALENLLFTISVPAGSGRSWTFDVMVNGAVSATGVISGASDTSVLIAGPVVVAEGDNVEVRITPAGSPAGDIHDVVYEWVGDVEAESVYGASSDHASETSIRYRGVIGGVRPWNADIEDVETIMPIPGTIRGMHATSVVSGGLGIAGDLAIMINGVRQVTSVLSISGPNGTTFFSNSFEVAFVRGDRVAVEWDPAPGAHSFSNIGVSCCVRADQDGYSIMCSSPNNSMASTNRYAPPINPSNHTWQITEVWPRICRGSVTPFSVGQAIGYLTVAPGGVTARTFNGRKNASATGITFTITGSEQMAGDIVNSMSITSADTFGWQHVLTGSPVAAQALLGLSQFIGSEEEVCVVPDLSEMNQADAIAAIIAAGYVPGSVTYEYSAEVPAGTVISQSLAAGDEDACGLTIDIVISALVDESVPCCPEDPAPCECPPAGGGGTGSVPTGSPSSEPIPSATGPVTPISLPIGPADILSDPYWTAVCDGGGLVLTAADPVDAETWVS